MIEFLMGAGKSYTHKISRTHTGEWAKLTKFLAHNTELNKLITDSTHFMEYLFTGVFRIPSGCKKHSCNQATEWKTTSIFSKISSNVPLARNLCPMMLKSLRNAMVFSTNIRKWLTS
uniref:Uncharacterized protein n=1 Tax=Percolomonas cosmopolitus TaxID=63605 RepID=A0A7S1KRH1_9EUKA